MKGMEDVTYALTYQDVIEILRIVDDTPEGQELSLEIGNFKLTVRKQAPGRGRGAGEAGRAGVESPKTPAVEPPGGTGGSLAPAAGTPPHAPTVTTGASATPSSSPSAVTLRAPMVGTFYRAPAPGAAPFVEVGTEVQPDDIVGIIEVMKLMNEIRAGHRGRVAAVLAENGTLVEYGQPLVVIEPGA